MRINDTARKTIAKKSGRLTRYGCMLFPVCPGSVAAASTEALSPFFLFRRAWNSVLDADTESSSRAAAAVISPWPSRAINEARYRSRNAGIVCRTFNNGERSLGIPMRRGHVCHAIITAIVDLQWKRESRLQTISVEGTD